MRQGLRTAIAYARGKAQQHKLWKVRKKLGPDKKDGRGGANKAK